MSLLYLDTSVALAHLLSEDRRPADSLWQLPLVSSRLLQYGLWVRLNALKLGGSHGDAAHEVLARIAFIELQPPILARALEPFPVALRTLDALHLASIEFLRAQRQEVALASYDLRMLEAARRLDIPIATL